MNVTFWKYWLFPWDFRVEEKYAWASSIGPGAFQENQNKPWGKCSLIHPPEKEQMQKVLLLLPIKKRENSASAAIGLRVSNLGNLAANRKKLLFVGVFFLYSFF